MVRWLEQMVIPSEEAAIKLKAEKKTLAGGDLSGRRGWASIMEVASNVIAGIVPTRACGHGDTDEVWEIAAADLVFGCSGATTDDAESMPVE